MNSLKVRGIFFSFVFALLALFAAHPAAAAVTTTEVAFSESICGGETITGTATLHVVSVETEGANGSGGVFLVNARLQGSGTDSEGTQYQFSESLHTQFAGGSGSVATTGTLHITTRLIGQGNAPNLQAFGLAHLTFNNNGDITADLTLNSFSCE